MPVGVILPEFDLFSHPVHVCLEKILHLDTCRRHRLVTELAMNCVVPVVSDEFFGEESLHEASCVGLVRVRIIFPIGGHSQV